MYRKNLALSLSLIITVCYLSIIGIPSVFACSPSEDARNLTLEDRVENAPMILVGTVIDGYLTGGSYEYIHRVEVEVETYLRGEGPAIVQIEGFGQGADCRTIIQLDRYAIFFVEGNPDDVLDAVYTGVADATWTASPDNIEAVIAITGENNAPYPLPLITQIARFVSQYGIWIVSITILVIILTLGLWIVRQVRNPRKTKVKRT